jgi:hypothetical protein
MSDKRTVRKLSALQDSASTARVLNLLQTHKRFPDDQELIEKPFFENKVLNHSIIVKHKLRPEEYALFKVQPPSTTKVLLPIDGTDLRYGAHSFFIDQKDYDRVLDEYLGDDLKPGTHDRMVLELVARLPTLDPFLLKEYLARDGFHPARAYFAVSDGDIRRMVDFVRSEVMALVTLSAGGDQVSAAYASRLVNKLLSNAPDAGFEPLRETLKLSPQEYADGMFSWRGFLYYKWQMRDLMMPMGQVMDEIAAIRGRGPQNAEAAAYIPEAKQRIAERMVRTTRAAQKSLAVYDDAFNGLTRRKDPSAFRNFLIEAPSMFFDLGKQLGAIQHIISFWRYRFPNDQRRLISPDELMDILLDFEDSLGFAC